MSRVLLAEMIVLDELPFSTVEKIESKAFVNSLRPPTDFVLPSSDCVVKDCTKIVEERLQPKLKALLTKITKSNRKISFKSDIWTSAQSRSYMTITASFINDNTILLSIVNFFRVRIICQ